MLCLGCFISNVLIVDCRLDINRVAKENICSMQVFCLRSFRYVDTHLNIGQFRSQLCFLCLVPVQWLLYCDASYCMGGFKCRSSSCHWWKNRWRRSYLPTGVLPWDIWTKIRLPSVAKQTKWSHLSELTHPVIRRYVTSILSMLALVAWQHYIVSQEMFLNVLFFIL